MKIFRKEKIKNEIFAPQIFSSQEINHKTNFDFEKKSNANSSEILIYHKKNEKEEEKNITKGSLNDYLAQKNDKDNLDNDNILNNFEPENNSNHEKIKINDLNSPKNINDFIYKENEKEELNSNINNEKINNIELDNEWNESEINFCDVSMVSKINSYDNNNEQSNITDNNILFKSENLDFNNALINKDFNKEENNDKKINEEKINNQNKKSSFISNSSNNSFTKSNKNKIKDIDDINLLKKEKEKLEEKLKREQNINKDKSYYIEILKKALNDNFLNNNNSTNNKNSLNIGIVLEYSKCKLENENFKKNIIMQKILCDDVKNEYQTLKKEKEKLIEKLNSYKNTIIEKNEKLEELETRLKGKQNSEEQLNAKLSQQKLICSNLKNDITNLNTKNLELVELIEKMNKNKNNLNIGQKTDEYYENLLNDKNKEIDILKLENNEININDAKGEFMNNDIINNSCKNIEDFSKKIKMYYNKFNENSNQIEPIILKTLKDYLDNINPDFNGNISLNDKLKIIYEFIHFIKSKLEILCNHYEIFQMNNFNFDRIKDEKNIFASSNGQNNEKNIEINKKIIGNNNSHLLNNALFKKINLKKYKSNTFANNDLEESKKIDNNDFLSNTRSNFYDNKKIVFQSNLSEISKSPLDITSNNSRLKNNKIDDLFSNIFKEKLKQKKNIINLKANDITNLTLMNVNDRVNQKNYINSFMKSTKRSEMNISNDLSKIESNIFPSNKKVLSIKERNDIILSSNNTTRKNLKTKNENSENKSLYAVNLKENIHSYHSRKTTVPLTFTNTNTKKMINNKNTIYYYTIENSKIMESSYKKRIGKNDKNNLSLGMLKKELFSNNNKRKRNMEINELAEEIMKPSFLKGNNTLTINSSHQKEMMNLNPFKAIKKNKILLDLSKRKK